MLKAVIVVLAGTESKSDLGRVVNALEAVKEFKQNDDDDVRLVFDGAGVQWIRVLAASDHDYHLLFEEVRDRVQGICSYCANAFEERDAVEKAGLPFVDEFEGHPSFRGFVKNGYSVITF